MAPMADMNTTQNQERYQSEMDKVLESVFDALLEETDDSGDKLRDLQDARNQLLLDGFSPQESRFELNDSVQNSLEPRSYSATAGSVPPAAWLQSLEPLRMDSTSDAFFSSGVDDCLENRDLTASQGQEKNPHQHLPTTQPSPFLLGMLDNVSAATPWCQKVIPSTINNNDNRGNTANDHPSQQSPRFFPCRARGIESSHNEKNAVLVVPPGCKHGTVVVCSNQACAASGRQFRYCSVCDRPVAKRTFVKRHSHGLTGSDRFITIIG
mmetsp:Transcript_33960/g.78301  ORF Transcript_33960/g.78301 Transcript_33960/m.78301 type:complete len:267 (-) Transcript_33960:28-828(-)